MSEELTGEMRHRVEKKLFSGYVLVLEVGYKVKDGGRDLQPSFLSATHWRTARVEDLTKTGMYK